MRLGGPARAAVVGDPPAEPAGSAPPTRRWPTRSSSTSPAAPRSTCSSSRASATSSRSRSPRRSSPDWSARPGSGSTRRSPASCDSAGSSRTTGRTGSSSAASSRSARSRRRSGPSARRSREPPGRTAVGEERERPAPGVGRVVGAVVRAGRVVHEAVARHPRSGRPSTPAASSSSIVLRRGSTDRSVPKMPSTLGVAAARTASIGVALAGARPVLGHVDHAVEGDDAVEAAGRERLQRVHATHAEADQAATGSTHPRSRRRRRRRRRAWRRPCERPRRVARTAPRGSRPARWPGKGSTAHTAHRCSSASRCDMSSNSGRRPQMSGHEHQATVGVARRGTDELGGRAGGERRGAMPRMLARRAWSAQV